MNYFEADAEMHDDERDAEEPASSYHDDDDAVGGGTSTPVWPPADATSAQLEDWLDSFRRLPEDEGILARQDLLSRRIRMPMPAPPASPFTFVLRAKRATDKRRRQLHRFIAMRDDFLAQERALQASIVDAHATITATLRLLTLAEDEEYERSRSYASSLDAPGRVPSPDAAGAASADAARQAGHDPDAAVGASGIITQLLMLLMPPRRLPTLSRPTRRCWSRPASSTRPSLATRRQGAHPGACPAVAGACGGGRGRRCSPHGLGAWRCRP